ncbi:MAG TPA: hypothetical protein VF713_22820 [Thermoanaerobaculia bacterium]
MPVVSDDCTNFFLTLAKRFPFLKTATPGEPKRLDAPHGITASFLIRPPELMQSFVFVYFPHDSDEWLPVARDTFTFEAECWRRWCAATRGTLTEYKPFRRHYPPPAWTGLDEQVDDDGTPLIGGHETTVSHLDRQRKFPVLVRPYVPWMPLNISGSLAPLKQQVERVVRAVVPQTVSRPIDYALADLDGTHLLGFEAYLVPTKWRVFHRTAFGLGLSREERMRRTPQAQPVTDAPTTAKRRWFKWW